MSAVPPVLSQASPESIRAQYDLAFQISPIILQGGLAAQAQGGLIPISNLTDTGTDEPFARYVPMPGTTLVSQSVGMYPFANQAVAANATIQQPLTVSVVMIAPVNIAGGYLQKLQIFSALQATLVQHNAAGGMYIVATPSFVFKNLLMTGMVDVSGTGEDEHQQQISWQIDFIQPIVTLAGAEAAQNALMQKLTNGQSFSGQPAWSGNQSSSPANLTGVTGALGNVEAALATFGGSLT